MSLAPFTVSEPLTLGVELELQLVNTHDYDLRRYADDMLRLMAQARRCPGNVMPEITASMIEISTDIVPAAHGRAGRAARRSATRWSRAADQLNIALCRRRHARRSSNGASGASIRHAALPASSRELYGYLAKQFTVFGQHVHVGCPDRRRRAVPAAFAVALHSALHRAVGLVAVRAGRGHAVRLGAAEFGVRVSAVGPRAVRADLGRVRGLLRARWRAPAWSTA